MHLLKKTFDAYSKNFVKLNYEEYFNLDKIEVEKINSTEISKSLNIAKETARRKIIELEKLGAIKRINKKFIIDKNAWANIKPENTIKSITRFLSTLSKMVYNEGFISEPIRTEKLDETAKEYFSYVWKLYYEMQIPWLLDFKELFGDLESFHIDGIIISNQALNSKKNNNNEMSKEFYIEKYFFADKKDFLGISAMSISDITSIPRATVIRKLHKLIKEKFLKIDSKKHYSVTGDHKKKILEAQTKTLNNLSKFAARIYNLSLVK